MIHSGKKAQTTNTPIESSSKWVVNFTCPHSAKDIDGWNGDPAVGRPTERIKTRVDELGITPEMVFCNGDWGSLQSSTPEEQAIEEPKIQDDINNGGYNGKMLSIVGNHIAGKGDLDHYTSSVWDTLTRDPFPYPITYDDDADYEFERYYVTMGNTIHIMLSDRNDIAFPWGKDGTTGSGGHPNGAITLETVQWLTDVLARHRDYISFIYVHEGIAETTVATGYGDGTEMGHNAFPIEDGSGNIYTIVDLASNPDVGYDQTTGNNWFLNQLSQWPKFFDMASQGHSHAQFGYEINSRGKYHEENGALFFNCGAACKNHGSVNHANDPLFSLIEFREDSKVVTIHPVSIDGQNRHGVTVSAGLVPQFNRTYVAGVRFTETYSAPTVTRPSSTTLTEVVNGSDTDLSWSNNSDCVLILHNDSSTPTAPTDNEAEYPQSFETSSGDRVVYFGTGSSFTDSGTTGGNYAIYTANSGGGSILWA